MPKYEITLLDRQRTTLFLFLFSCLPTYTPCYRFDLTITNEYTVNYHKLFPSFIYFEKSIQIQTEVKNPHLSSVETISLDVKVVSIHLYSIYQFHSIITNEHTVSIEIPCT